MTEKNTTMNNQAVTFKHFTLNDIIEYLEKRNPDEEMVYSLTFDALSRVGEIKLIARKEKTTVSKNLSTINLIVSDAVKKSVAFFKIDAAVIPVCEMAMGIIFGEAKNIQSPKQVSNNESINKRMLNIDDLQKIMPSEEDQEGMSMHDLLLAIQEIENKHKCTLSIVNSVADFIESNGTLSKKFFISSVGVKSYNVYFRVPGQSGTDDIFARFKILSDDWARIDTKKVAVFYYNGSCLPEKLTRKVFAQVCEQVISETAQILKAARNSYSDNTGPASDLVTPAFKDEGVNKLAKKDKHPCIHVSFFDTSVPVLEIVDDKGAGKAIVQHLMDKGIVSSLRYFDETGKVTKVINVTLS